MQAFSLENFIYINEKKTNLDDLQKYIISKEEYEEEIKDKNKEMGLNEESQIISNLIRSSSSSTKTKFTWLNEYLDGVEQEIYRTSLNEKFKDKTFSQISKIIYENFDAIAFAFEIEIYGKAYIFLNPGDFFIHKFFLSTSCMVQSKITIKY